MSGFQDNIVKFKNNKKYMTILYVVIAIAFIAFFLYQVFKINYEPVKTEVALEKTVSASAVTQAFIVRDEYPIEASVTGTLVPLVEDGKRVASGDNVAVVFTSDEAAKTYNEIKELEKKELGPAQLCSDSGPDYPDCCDFQFQYAAGGQQAN